MNEVRIVNYTLIAAFILLLAAYVTSMQNLTKINNYDNGLYIVTGMRI